MARPERRDIEQIFIEYLLYARYFTQYWGRQTDRQLQFSTEPMMERSTMKPHNGQRYNLVSQSVALEIVPQT